MVIEIISPEIIEVNKDASNVTRRGTSKETTWQKMSIYIKRKKQKKTLT